MVKALMFGIVFAAGMTFFSAESGAQERNFREYQGFMRIPGASRAISFEVDEEVIETPSKNSGLLRELEVISMQEGDSRCLNSKDQKVGRINLENGIIETCSGLTLVIQRPADLLKEKTFRAEVRARDGSKIGEADFILFATRNQSPLN